MLTCRIPPPHNISDGPKRCSHTFLKKLTATVPVTNHTHKHDVNMNESEGMTCQAIIFARKGKSKQVD